MCIVLENKPPYEIAIANKQIHVDDGLAFRVIVDVCRCFGKNYKAIQRCYFHIGHDYQLWCPPLAIMICGKPQAVAKDWVNVLSEDWSRITETSEDSSRVEGALPPHFRRPRITFAKFKDVSGVTAYRFVGVFQLEYIQKKENSGTLYNKTYYRMQDYIDLSPWMGNVN